MLEEKNGKQSYAQVIAFLEDLTGSKFATISADILNRRKFIQFVGKEKQIESPKNVITREKVRENLRIPSDYYIERNFLRETLDAYDVGNCFNRGKQMYMRCVVPCYNERFELVGAVGRSLNEQCSICETYHFKNKPCPSNDLEKRWAAKWINSDGFKSGHHFYNMQYAKKRIIDTQSVILVEGQGDIWRLHEAGIHNALGLFGLELTDQKFEILAQMDIMNIYLALDSDSAGLEAANKIEAKLSRYYNLERIRLTAKDIGDMTASEVKEIFKGVLI